ncbi:hypothetical protein JKP88DRAFT_347708 [Tribonema minus]|uniref:Uncharacterized protein n=1 Tax=Tribonema minus TaxID=303371 RepID=A0A835ZER0_9STRA|nr:hypothetical protein JKP88DRAFT_347708 [Tribonema minus]
MLDTPRGLTRQLQAGAPADGQTPIAKYCEDQVYNCYLDEDCAACYNGLQAQGGKIPRPDTLTCPNLLVSYSKALAAGCDVIAKGALHDVIVCFIDISVANMPCGTNPVAALTQAPTVAPSAAPTVAPTQPKVAPGKGAIAKQCKLEGLTCAADLVCAACVKNFQVNLRQQKKGATCASYLALLQKDVPPACDVTTAETPLNDLMECVVDTLIPQTPCGSGKTKPPFLGQFD